MPYVGRKSGNHAVQVRATLDPCCQSMNCKRMSQIMQPRLIACAIIASNASHSTKPLKCLTRGTFFERISFFSEEEFQSIHLAPSVIRGVISPQHLVQVWANRNLPRTIEPSAADGNRSPFEIYILTKEPASLTDQGSRPVEEQQECSKGACVDFAAALLLRGSNCGQEKTNLSPRVDVGNKCCQNRWSRRGHRHR